LFPAPIRGVAQDAEARQGLAGLLGATFKWQGQ